MRTHDKTLPSVVSGQPPQRPTESPSSLQLESKGSNASSGFAEDEVTANIHNSKYVIYLRYYFFHRTSLN